MTQELDLHALRKVAEAATPGPWIAHEAGEEPGNWWVWQESKLPYYGGVAEVVGRDSGTICYPEISGGHGDGEGERLDATHIATFDPPTVLTLLSRLEQAEQAVQRVRELHPITFYDKWGRTSLEPASHGGWCSNCGRFDGDACRTIRALDGDGRG